MKPEEYAELLTDFENKIGARSQFIADFEKGVDWLYPIRSFLVGIAIILSKSATLEEWEDLRKIPNNHTWTLYKRVENTVKVYQKVTDANLNKRVKYCLIEVMCSIGLMYCIGKMLSHWI